ncbi:unnamed protein product [Boreogadus saida]
MQDCEGTPQHVYMVDTHANYPPVPRRSVPSKPLPPPPSQGARSCQVLAVMLLFLMISSSAIQAVFLYRLYYPTADADSPSASKLTDDIGCASPPTKAPPKLSKPMAHLTGNGYNIRPGKEALSWTTVGDIVLREMKYMDGELFVKNAGFYFVYSKFLHRRWRWWWWWEGEGEGRRSGKVKIPRLVLAGEVVSMAARGETVTTRVSSTLTRGPVLSVAALEPALQDDLVVALQGDRHPSGPSLP